MANRQLALGTISFAICFAAWGLISAFATRFREIYNLSASQTAFLIAAPVLLGSLARIPMGLLTDHWKGRAVFSGLLLFSAIPPLLAPVVSSYSMLLVVGFLLGMAGSSFAVGVGFVSPWFGREQQGTALGVYGLGNAGQSVVVFLGPLLAARFGWETVFRSVSVLLVIWAAVFALSARNAPATAPPRKLGAMLALLGRERLAWVLSAFYFLTFGGFVAFSIYLPALLRQEFQLTAADAGFRTAGFVLLATGTRPIGGWLSDRIGGAHVLSLVFLGVVPFALLLAWPSMVPFTVGALGCAALLGAGSGAVFKLVPQYFAAETGTVTGLVGAMGGLGGFFPPLLLGFFRDRLGMIWPGFVLLALTAFVLWIVNNRVFLPRDRTAMVSSRNFERLRASAWATLWTAVLIAAIVVGSRNLANLDPALVIYTFAVIFATWGVVYHYNVWLEKPPTRLYWERGWQLLHTRGIGSIITIVRTSATHLVGQRFIQRRSALRWWMHQCIFWGCLLAVVITFPLVFGWIAFRSRPDDQMIYVTYLFGFPAGEFRIRTLVSSLLFHGLDIAAVLVLAGIGLSLWRRMRDQGAQPLQSFAMDFFPLTILFAISISGLALTASQEWLRGVGYSFLSILHAITVVAGLLYLPFGKFFHIFQRPAQLGVKLYQEVGDAGERAQCVRCGQRFASRMHIDDLRRVLPQVGFNYQIGGGAGHWQALCPTCKRKTLAGAQLRAKEQSRG
ncbi:MAG: NarK/NasA family nitrate transporter [Acidobacteriia bacterium]|nr:NarK/NasA family nitrate transporter [Terriglobia bacterium]